MDLASTWWIVVEPSQSVHNFSCVQYSVVMPSKKSRKTRCCTSCGRRTKGHLGVVGQLCRMDDLLKQEEEAFRSNSEAESVESDIAVDPPKPDEERKQGGKPKFWKSPRSSEPVSSVEDNLSILTGQISVLSGALAQLVGETASIKKALKIEPVDNTESSGASVLKEAVEKRGKAVGVHSSNKFAVLAGGEPEDSVVALPTTRTLGRDKELNKLLSLYHQDRQDFLSVREDGTSGASPVAVTQGERLKKHLSIVDFISRTDGPPLEDEETLVTTSGTKLVLSKSTSKKIEVQNVTVPQWISANSRIYDLLTPTMSRLEMASYNEYVRVVGDLLQIYTVSSIMCMDEEHRRLVNATGRSWCDVSLHLERMFLKIKAVVPETVAQPVQNSSAKSTVAKKSSNLCFAYNNRGGCRNGDSCKYKHLCSNKEGSVFCKGKHPKWDHERFHPSTQPTA